MYLAMASESFHVGKLVRRCLDRVAGLQEYRSRVPRAVYELITGALGHDGLDQSVAEANFLLLHVHGDGRLGRALHRLLQPLQVFLGGPEAGDAQHHAVAEEDLAEGAAHDGADAPAHQGLGRVLTRRPAAEVLAHHQDRGALVGLLVERVLGVLLARVLEGVLAHRVEGHGFEEAGGDDAVGVDVVACNRDAAARDLAALVVGHRRAHFRISLTSVTAPVMAAAATMAGLIKSVRPVGLPWRPMKLRLLEDALISRPLSLSSFMPRHIEQPALRHWKPAAWKIS